MHQPIRMLRTHLSALSRRSKASYLWRVWLEAVLVAHMVAMVAQLLFPTTARSDLAGKTFGELSVLVLLIGPLAETLAFQCLPLEFTAPTRIRRWVRVLISVVPFALMHHSSGIPTVLAAGTVGGFYFAFTYETWRRESVVIAVLMTFLLHASYNAVGVIGMLLPVW